MYMTKRKRLGEMLVDAHLITEAQLHGALGRQKKWGGRLGNNLVKLGNISEVDLLRFLAAQTGVEEVDLENIRILPHIIKLVPEKVADKYTVIPVAMKGPNVLMVASADPTDLAALDHIGFVTGHKIEAALATHSQISRAIDQYYRAGRPRTQEIAMSDDEDMTVELSWKDVSQSQADPELIIFGQSKPGPAPTNQEFEQRPVASPQRPQRMGPPPNQPDPFHSSAGGPSLNGTGEFTLDFNDDLNIPGVTQPGNGLPPLPSPPRGQNNRPQQAQPQRRPQPQRPQQQGPRSFTIEQKMRALYNVLIRKGLVREAEIQQELMRLWQAGKL